jgi:dihydrofolate synthase/folylpolyglutamate synthase
MRWKADWSFRDARGVGDLPLPQVPLPNAATALAALRASGLAVVSDQARDGIRDAMLPGRFQIISEPRGDPRCGA